jgi:hypothetical protein
MYIIPRISASVRAGNPWSYVREIQGREVDEAPILG